MPQFDTKNNKPRAAVLLLFVTALYCYMSVILQLLLEVDRSRSTRKLNPSKIIGDELNQYCSRVALFIHPPTFEIRTIGVHDSIGPENLST
jgi:hypothetical protein